MHFLERARAFTRKPEGFFVVVSSLFGLLFLFTFPPLQTPDEASHFLRTYQVSQLDFVPITHGGLPGGYLPASIGNTIELLDTKPSLRFHPEIKYDIHRTKAALNMPLEKTNTIFIPGVANYPPVGYVPQAIGVAMGTIFNLPAVALMYIARAASLVTWIFLIFMAIKVVPQKKWAFVGVGLLPMLLSQAVSPGIDAVSIGLAVLFVAVVLRLKNVKNISTKWLILMILLASLIALTKQTGILVLGFIFLLRTSQFDKDKLRAIAKKLLVVTVPIFLFISWMSLTIHLDGAGTSVSGQNSSAQLINILQHPFRFIQVMFNTFFTTWGDEVVRSFVGNFGWMDTPLAGGIITVGYIFIAFLLFVNYSGVSKNLQLSCANKWLVLMLVFLYVTGNCIALYLLYSPVDFSVIHGLQGRYFLLILFMLIPLFANVALRISRKKFVSTVQVLSLFLLVSSALTIYLRYYITLF